MKPAVCRAADDLVAQGVQAIAVCYLFSFLHPEHELRTRELIAAHHPDIAGLPVLRGRSRVPRV